MGSFFMIAILGFCIEFNLINPNSVTETLYFFWDLRYNYAYKVAWKHGISLYLLNSCKYNKRGVTYDLE